MKLACEGCDWTTEGETADALVAAMMVHGEEVHSVFEGKSPEEIEQMKKGMDAHIRQLIVDQN